MIIYETSSHVFFSNVQDCLLKIFGHLNALQKNWRFLTRLKLNCNCNNDWSYSGNFKKVIQESKGTAAILKNQDVCSKLLYNVCIHNR